MQPKTGAVLFPHRPFHTEWKTKEEHEVLCMIVEVSLLEHFYFDENSVWKQIHKFKDGPIIRLTDDECKVVVSMANIIEIHEHNYGQYPHYGKMCLSLAHAFFYMLLDSCTTAPSVEIKTSAPDNKDLIFKEFLHLLQHDGGRLYKVSDYASRLFISSQYLSKICIERGGQSPSDFINERVADEIKMHLLYSNKSVKEIAAHLNFSSPSFFGRFVKEHLGMTPRQLRLKHKN